MNFSLRSFVLFAFRNVFLLCSLSHNPQCLLGYGESLLCCFVSTLDSLLWSKFVSFIGYISANPMGKDFDF